MCTVTYIPSKEGFYLTSNRDESINRGQAIAPREYDGGKSKLIYPKDADKNGSWIAAKNNGDAVVLLNGAFIKHAVQPHYKTSRGLVLMDIIQADYPDLFYKAMDLVGVEPFTIVLYVSGKLYECRWDGERKQILLLDRSKSYIWSSATLYDKMAIAKRKSWFNEFRKSRLSQVKEGILHFHRYGGAGDVKDGLVIDRDGKMKTMSITNITISPLGITMIYNDLKDQKQYTSKLALEPGIESTKGKAAKIRLLMLRIFFIKLFNWEYWPFRAVYLLIMPYWFWLGLKARSLFFFNTSNPLIQNGGFAMESKDLIYALMPDEYYPRTLCFKAGTDIAYIQAKLQSKKLTYPAIAKPDIGGRGVLVKKVHNDEELAGYIKNMKVDFLLQEFVEFKKEVGIFYYRIPGEEKGHISGIVGKEFLTVTGDGSSTIEELLINESRFLLQLKVLQHSHQEVLQQILNRGQNKTLVPYGNHARGAKFIDLSHLISEKLTNTIDAVCRQIPEFYFGRMDVMYNNWEDLCEGRNFSIVELNGAGSEPTHIYDSRHSIFFAWKEIIRHWKLLYRISKLNHEQQGLPYMTYRQGTEMLKNNTAYEKLVS
ncbi:NRDE family protein [Mucilaginibacter polytrichastri]|uniref:ATP-grasp domain-containing protein n=1 Tax=Mucilaginibacter polytrichastri TaxID=1302689 RepID=A0A1Q6A228_9SPHI|nr:NRDE family protein [Mucilaginibacter polytrichastri]OKS88075.1 hypothetical protein RG47T_3539 [Mucilaginibacter polytrichastri]SFT09985.1 Transport and Golgi organisation 2 [Mucilaginibacter polytrichastri]